MSDVDTQDAPEAEPTAADKLTEVLAKHQPANVGVYPETDVMRSVLSGGMPAGNADDTPPGADEVKSAMEDVLAEGWPEKPEKVAAIEGGARDFKLDVSSAGGGTQEEPA